ncbi:MAG: hypothetical protein AYP45_16105 [Candidatus Brocadia carolinensis]|uniref:OB domain-containing protein n=1 Tax=Candidatus Brocadia carolinensis TaxID=1004156 RepID=A0A1V4AQ07_9BACT|nr:MAG: hypothetical protein AYP45_16105 [Candidatus Brocadia caroliniensis]
MLAKISGRVTNIKEEKTKTGKTYCVVKVMQLDKEGDGKTIPVKFWDIKKVSEIKKDAMIEIEVRVEPAINKSTGMPLLNANAA